MAHYSEMYVNRNWRETATATTYGDYRAFRTVTSDPDYREHADMLTTWARGLLAWDVERLVKTHKRDKQQRFYRAVRFLQQNASLN